MKKNILVTYTPDEEEKDIYREVLENIANVHYLADKTRNERI